MVRRFGARVRLCVGRERDGCFRMGRGMETSEGDDVTGRADGTDGESSQ